LLDSGRRFGYNVPMVLKEELKRIVEVVRVGKRTHFYVLMGLVVLSFLLTLQMLNRVEDHQSFVTVDAPEYLSIVKNLEKGNGYKITEGDTFSSNKETSYRTPGYPFFLLVMKGIFGAEKFVTATVAYQHLLLALLPLMFYYLASGLTYNKNYALLAALLAFLFYPFRFLATIIHPDFLAFFILLVALCLFMRNMKRKSILNVLGFSLCLASAIMIKQNLFILVLLFIYPLPKLLKRKELLVALIFPLLFVSSWVVRNYAVHERFPVFSTNTGINFYFANHPDIGANLKNITRYNKVMKNLILQGYNEVDADRELLKQGFRNMVKNGFWWQVKRTFTKLQATYRDFYPPAKNEVFFLVLPFLLLMKRKKYPLFFLIGYQLIYAVSVYQPGFNLLDFYYMWVLDIVPLNFIGIAALILFLRKKEKPVIFLAAVYVAMLLPTLVFIPLDRLTITADFLLILMYALSPLLLKEYFFPGERSGVEPGTK
jgi:4-amino-4-deoxy-L-arabinose transferase-like glycosyltransferase